MHLRSDFLGSTQIFPRRISHVIQVLHWWNRYQVVHPITDDWFSMGEDIRVKKSARVAFLHLSLFFQIIVIAVELQYGSMTSKGLVGLSTTHEKLQTFTFQVNWFVACQWKQKSFNRITTYNSTSKKFTLQLFKEKKFKCVCCSYVLFYVFDVMLLRIIFVFVLFLWQSILIEDIINVLSRNKDNLRKCNDIKMLSMNYSRHNNKTGHCIKSGNKIKRISMIVTALFNKEKVSILFMIIVIQKIQTTIMIIVMTIARHDINRITVEYILLTLKLTIFLMIY